MYLADERRGEIRGCAKFGTVLGVRMRCFSRPLADRVCRRVTVSASRVLRLLVRLSQLLCMCDQSGDIMQ